MARTELHVATLVTTMATLWAGYPGCSRFSIAPTCTLLTDAPPSALQRLTLFKCVLSDDDAFAVASLAPVVELTTSWTVSPWVTCPDSVVAEPWKLNERIGDHLLPHHHRFWLDKLSRRLSIHRGETA